MKVTITGIKESEGHPDPVLHRLHPVPVLLPGAEGDHSTLLDSNPPLRPLVQLLLNILLQLLLQFALLLQPVILLQFLLPFQHQLATLGHPLPQVSYGSEVQGCLQVTVHAQVSTGASLGVEEEAKTREEVATLEVAEAGSAPVQVHMRLGVGNHGAARSDHWNAGLDIMFAIVSLFTQNSS